MSLLEGVWKVLTSVKFGDYTCSFQLLNTWDKSVSVEISGLFKHPLRGCLKSPSNAKFTERTWYRLHHGSRNRADEPCFAKGEGQLLKHPLNEKSGFRHWE